MGKYCQICKKGLMSGNNVSHSKRRTRRVWAPNTQRVRVVVNGTTCHMNGVSKRMSVCTRCLRSGKVQRAQ